MILARARGRLGTPYLALAASLAACLVAPARPPANVVTHDDAPATNPQPALLTITPAHAPASDQPETAPLPVLAMPGPGHGPGRPDAPARNAACEGCHREIADEWRGSLHQRAYIDKSFTASLAREPDAFCRGCHAPEADPDRPAPRALARLGVGCITCHVPEHDVLAAPRDDHAPAPHPVVRDARFASVAACSNCHEFAFPDATESQDPMQRTVQEHALSAYSTVSCAGCHMPNTGGHRDHRFIASRDPDTLRRGLETAAARVDDERAILTLVPGTIGHAMPTGDLFRRLVVEADVRDDRGRPLAAVSEVLGRRFERTGDRRYPVGDDRVGAYGPVPVELTLDLGPLAVGRAIRWRVFHERVDFVDEHGKARVHARTLIAEGELPPG